MFRKEFEKRMQEEIFALAKVIKAIMQWRIAFNMPNISMSSAVNMYHSEVSEYLYAYEQECFNSSIEKDQRHIRYEIVDMLYTLVQIVDIYNRHELTTTPIDLSYDNLYKKISYVHRMNCPDMQKNYHITTLFTEHNHLFLGALINVPAEEYSDHIDYVFNLLTNIVYLNIFYRQIYQAYEKGYYNNEFFGVEGFECAFDLVNRSNYSKRMDANQFKDYIIEHGVQMFAPVEVLPKQHVNHYKTVDFAGVNLGVPIIVNNQIEMYVLDITISPTELLKVVERDGYYYVYDMTGKLRKPHTFIKLL